MTRPASLALALLLAALAPAVRAETAAPAPDAARALPAISVTEVAPATLRDRVVTSGLVAAVEEVQVQPLVEGQPIDALLADVGDRVEAGEVLARLSTSTLDLQRSELDASRASVAAAVAQAEAALLEARVSAEEAIRVSDRAQALSEQGTVPASQAEQALAASLSAQARVRVAEQGIASARAQDALVTAQIETLELSLARAEVKAPVAGLVVERNAQVGAIAAASGDPMFTIVRDGAMELRADLSESDVVRVEPGQPALLAATGWPEPIAGTVRLVEPAIDTATRLGTARITIEDPTLVVEGMFLSAEVLVEEAEILAVPATAVGSGAEGPVVMRVVDGVVEEVPVTTTIRDGTLVGVSAGLSEGDLVVTRAAAFVRDGDRIDPVTDGGDVVAAAAPASTATATAAANAEPEEGAP
jgi:HlyD family secretion protein